MNIRDIVFISIGELVLAGTFVLGVMVGVSLQKRKESQDDDSNEGTVTCSQGWAEWNRNRGR